jgi:K+-transporting ATPase ATPase C chain
MLLSSCLAVLFFTVLLGLGYGLALTGIAQAIFPGQADGSKITLDGKVVGSSLIGQEFRRKRYFQPRPSQTGYAPDTTYFSNLGPNSVEARELVRENIAAYLRLEKPFDRSLSREDVPVDAITQSGSGVDPHISEANARIQARRIAAVRDLPSSQVEDLISANTDGRFLGLLGEPGVNVLELNLALDQEAPIK